MPLRFSEDGPEFPSRLVDAWLRGEVVLLCGAGISMPQLPGFRDLVDRCYKKFHLEKDLTENLSWEKGRYEELLGSLSRRLADPDELVRTVSDQVKLPEAPDLTRHRTVLRLSRDIENRPTVVTTNFDTLIEHAWSQDGIPSEAITRASFAGQALPLPGSAAFHGIIHLHGRIGDAAIGVDPSPLVMTSADYGDAYMRSGWVSRFLFDLCRCKTLVLVGYSANDAPVRYFLNVLEADRARFPDLRTVYALDAVKDSEEETVARWAALAVEALPYGTESGAGGGSQSHVALWRDLEKLAELVERPKPTRRCWASDLLAKPFGDASQTERNWVTWLFAGKSDLFDLVIQVVRDSAWLDFFAEQKLSTDEEAESVFAAWVAMDFRCKARFQAALVWHTKLGRRFRSQLTSRLGQNPDLPEPWRRAWHLVSVTEPLGHDRDGLSFDVRRKLANSSALYADLRKAVDLLSPRLFLEPNRGEEWGHAVPNPPQRLADLTRSSMIVPDCGDSAELVNALVRHAQPLMLTRLATAALNDTIALAVDACMIREDFDHLDFHIPAIEPHRQNDHRDGAIFLTQLLARLLPAVTDADAEMARRHAEEWRAMPGRVGLRLWMHALRSSSLYDSTTAIKGLLSLSLDNFWMTHRELALVVRDRAGDAEQAIVADLEHRFIAEAQQHHERHEIRDGQPDWRGYARDKDVWFRLRMLADAGAISDAGTAELAAIVARHPHLDREVADRDFFTSYFSGVRFVAGNPPDIAEATEGDRLHVAQNARKSHDLEKQLGWRAFCDSNPEEALEVLREAALDDVNAPLWSDIISVLAHGAGGLANAARRNLVLSVFEKLTTADDQFLVLIVPAMADLYASAPRRTEPTIAAWWPRLFRAAITADSDGIEKDGDIVSQAINSPSGKLTNAVLVDLDAQRKENAGPLPALVDNLVTRARADGGAGILASAVIIRDFTFALSFDIGAVNDRMAAALTGDGRVPRALREVLVTSGRHSAAGTRFLGQAIFEGAVSADLDEGADWAALNLLQPALDVVRLGDKAEDWGLGPDDAARALREGSLALREGALEVMKIWIGEEEQSRATSWRTAVQPLMALVWPRERRFKHTRLSRKFTGLAVSAGSAFPEAFRYLQPYITPLHGYSGVHEIDASSAPEDHPTETLSLLWKLYGPDSQAESHDLPKLLDRLVAADPKLERDRRLQWLEQRYPRYE